MPILFATALPIILAKKENARGHGSCNACKYLDIFKGSSLGIGLMLPRHCACDIFRGKARTPKEDSRDSCGCLRHHRVPRIYFPVRRADVVYRLCVFGGLRSMIIEPVQKLPSVLGLCFRAIYFFVFRFLILNFDLPTHGRGDDKFFTKADYKARKASGGVPFRLRRQNNIVDVTNCATRLRVTAKDDNKIADIGTFTKHGAHSLVHNDTAIQVIVGLSVPQVRERFEALLNTPDEMFAKIRSSRRTC